MGQISHYQVLNRIVMEYYSKGKKAMKRLLLVLALAGLPTFLVQAEDPKSDKGNKEALPKKPVVTLKVGDPAPALKVGEWLQGEPVTHFEPGKVYVVEFWATWCGPCIAMMPHTADLQNEFKDQGVTMVSYTGKDPNNTREKVIEFVKKRGAKLPYAFAYNDDDGVWDGWMKDAGKGGIPCAFVIDKSGRIAFIGHPMVLGGVLPKVIAGAPPQAISEEAEKIRKEWFAAIRIQGNEDADKIKASVKALNDFEAKYPFMENVCFSISTKLRYLPKIGNMEETKKVAEAAMTKALACDDQFLLRAIASNLREGPAKDNKQLVALAVKASEANLNLAGDNDVPALIDISKTYAAAGDKAKAATAIRKAGQNAGDKDVRLLTMVANALVTLGDKSEAKKLADKAAKAIDDKPPLWQLVEVAKTYSAIGDKAESGRFASRAVAATDGDANMMRYVETQLRKREDEKQEEKK